MAVDLVVDFTFRGIDSVKDLKNLELSLIYQRLWYPKYEKWVTERCIPDIESGWKKVISVFYGKEIIGDAIFQPHKELPKTLEFKNMRIDQRFWRRGIGYFLLKQVEFSRGENERIILDVDYRLGGTINFLKRCGYKILCSRRLYDPNNLDVIMLKEFPTDKPFLTDKQVYIN